MKQFYNVTTKFNNYVLTLSLNDSLKKSLLYSIYSLIFVFFVLNAQLLIVPFSIKYFVIMICILTASLLSLTSKNVIKITKRNTALYIGFILIGVSFLVTGLILNVIGYIAYAIFFLLIVPWICVSDIDWVLQIRCICNIGCIVNIIFLFFSFALCPLEEGVAYSSFVGNPNMLGMYMTLFVIFILYQNKSKPIDTVNQCLRLIVLVIDIVFIGLSESRGAMLATAAILMVNAFFHFKKRKSIPIKKILLFIIAFLVLWNLSILFLTNVTYHEVNESLKNNNVVDTENQTEVGSEDDSTLNIDGNNFEIIPDDASGVDNYIEQDEVNTREEHVLNKIFKGIFNNSRFTSGRVEIWLNFIKEIRVLGHTSENLEITTAIDGTQIRDAHNGILQISYSAGLFAGIGLSVIVFYAVIVLAKKIKCTSISKEGYIVIAISCVFLIYLMISAMYSPLYCFISFIFWSTAIKALC